MSEHENELLGAYVLGVLEEDEQTTLQQHLDGCEACRLELTDLREMEAALGELPPEALLDGPPEGGDLLLQRTLREVRAEKGKQTWQRRAAFAAAAVVAGVALIGGGTLVGRAIAPDAPPVAQPAPAASAPASAPAGPTASGTDPATGASMTVAFKPAAGWVRFSATVSGIAQGQQCRLYVVARDGTRREAGSWLVSEAGARSGTSLDSFALVPVDDVAAVQVENFQNQLLINVPV